MTTHITNSSKEVLSKFEASLFNITSIQRDRLNFIGKLDFSFFSGAEITKELINLKEYWVCLTLAGNPLSNSSSEYHEFATWQGLFQVRNYLSDKKHLQILIVSKQSIKLKNILAKKKWNQTKTEVLKPAEVWKYLGGGYLLPYQGDDYRKLKIVNMVWDKL